MLDNLPTDLLTGAADIAVRLFAPAQLDLVATRLGEVELGLYASRVYVDERGAPSSAEEWPSHALISFDPRGPLAGGLERALPSAQDAMTVLATDSLTAHLAAACAALGLAVFQRPIARRYPEPVDVTPPDA